MFTELMASGSGGSTEHELNVTVQSVNAPSTSINFDVPSDVKELIVIGQTYGDTTPSVTISNATSELLSSASGEPGAMARRIYKVIPTDSTINISISGGSWGSETSLIVIY